VAIANALQLETVRAMPAPSRFNYNDMASLKSIILFTAVLWRFFAADKLLYAVTFTFDLDLEHLQRIAYDETLYRIWMQSSNPRRSYCNFSVWPYDLGRPNRTRSVPSYWVHSVCRRTYKAYRLFVASLVVAGEQISTTRWVPCGTPWWPGHRLKWDTAVL